MLTVKNILRLERFFNKLQDLVRFNAIITITKAKHCSQINTIRHIFIITAILPTPIWALELLHYVKVLIMSLLKLDLISYFQRGAWKSLHVYNRTWFPLVEVSAISKGYPPLDTENRNEESNGKKVKFYFLLIPPQSQQWTCITYVSRSIMLYR